jgi:hypothetical protein
MDHAPWYRRSLRWGQTNLTEVDPSRYDADFWREHWRRTRVQGVIVNAGGIVAYYPSALPLHHRAETLGERDLYGEIVAAAREEGLTVIARMDSNRVAADFFDAHPDWICRDAEGAPMTQADKYVTCINSPYYVEYLPGVMREIIERSAPDGFADNSWAGLPRSRICYCDHCRARAEGEGHALPVAHDWDDPAYAAWVASHYRRRTELWEENNAVTMAAGGEHCRWMGMLSGEVLNNCNRFIDLREILARSEIIMLDHQRRTPQDGFEQNTEAGKRLHALLGWEKLIPESTPQYQLGSPAFRLASMPAAEVRLWSSAGFAGGIQPWWHHIGASHEDRRQYRTAEPIFRWHEANQDILVDREPIARIGVVWSQENHDRFGRDRAEERTLEPYRGATRALARAGLDWLPVHVADLGGAVGRFDVLVLPNVGLLSDADLAAIGAFVDAGGSLVVTGETSACDETGARRAVAGLAARFGLEPAGAPLGDDGRPELSIEVPLRHSYLRLEPENRSAVYGPADPTAPATTGPRHPVLDGLGDTDTLPFGGLLPQMRAGEGTTVLATWVPAFPIYPPETSWMRTPRSDVPALVVREAPSGARLVWSLADLDRCYARDGAFEHALVLANAVRWALGDRGHARVEDASGLVALTAYAQGDRRIVHLTSRLVTSPVPGRQDVLVPLGPVVIRLPWSGATTPSATLRVAGGPAAICREGDTLAVTVERLLDHEVVVID